MPTATECHAVRVPSSAAHPARPDEKRKLAALFGAAFADDAALAHVLPADVARREERLRRFFSYEVDRSARADGLWSTADGDGGAIWYPPEEWRPGVLDTLRQVPWSLRVFGRHSARAARIGTALAEHHPREPHWYLAYLAVRPGRQGTGIGTTLLRPVLEECDRSGVGAYLEASNERNRRLYQRHGFADREPLALADGGPTVFPMWRQPG